MHWLIIALLVSLGGLLLAAAGIVRHVLLQRRRPARNLPEGETAAVGIHEESDLESES
jgi:hypothetical protein